MSGRAMLAPWLLLCASCAGWAPSPDHPVSYGKTNDGALVDGVSLPDRGEGFVRARPGESTRYGTPQLVGALKRAAASVARHFPGTEPVRIGDLSGPGGGRHHRHGSHRSGRDADIIFYVTDAQGRPTRGRGWLAFDRFGAARETHGPGSGDVFFFDDARNWHFVRTLLLDPEARLQWIFVSNGLKARLLRYAIAHEPSTEAIFRASWVLHEPRGARRHDDHFHVRVACSARQRALGCHTRGPVWSWIRKDVEKPAGGEVPRLSDEALVHALLSENGRLPGEAEDGRAAQGASGD